ncbi:hypothetical protein [Absidia glauca]|uniref:Uncharacterized protein n=1 Tax=Absidia glauca TaxID=4829 RepID=A0A168LK85_ABSGL|nr:hypothetical protein [Absidia glauca]
MDIFTETVLSGLWKKELQECLDTTVDISDATCMTASRAITNVESGTQSKDEAELDLLMYGRTVDPLTRALLRGICVGMRKLPLVAIKAKESIGECELFTLYFDPILSSLLSNPDKNVLLRWSNVTSAKSGDMRPDATISKIHQRSFGASLGYGDVKVARQRTDHHALCHDLLRLGILTKDTLDQNKLEGSIDNMQHQIQESHISPHTLDEVKSKRFCIENLNLRFPSCFPPPQTHSKALPYNGPQPRLKTTMEQQPQEFNMESAFIQHMQMMAETQRAQQQGNVDSMSTGIRVRAPDTYDGYCPGISKVPSASKFVASRFVASMSPFAVACGKNPVTLRNYRRGARRMAVLAKEVSPALWNLELLVDAWTALCKITNYEFDEQLAVVKSCLDTTTLEENLAEETDL